MSTFIILCVISILWCVSVFYASFAKKEGQNMDDAIFMFWLGMAGEVVALIAIMVVGDTNAFTEWVTFVSALTIFVGGPISLFWPINKKFPLRFQIIMVGKEERL